VLQKTNMQRDADEKRGEMSVLLISCR